MKLTRIHENSRFLAPLFALLVTGALLLVPAVAFAAGNPVASAITVDGQAGAITVSWPVDGANAGYVIWRSPDASLDRARVVGVVEGADAKSFIDLTAVLGARYHYSVRAFTASQEAAAPGDSDWTGAVSLATPASSRNPHLGTRADARTASCVQCHSVMDAPEGSDSFLIDVSGEGTASSSDLCLVCHSTSVAAGIQNVALAFQEGGSGHSVDTSTSAGNAIDSCAACHNAHADSESVASLRPKKVRLAGEEKTVDSSTNGWCLACHAEGSPVSEEATISLTKPSYDDAGYPVDGTFPGQITYESDVFNAHASIHPTGTYAAETGMTQSDISRTEGDCRYCHVSHRSASFYDALLVVNDESATEYANRDSSDVAPLCFTCHSDVRDSLDTTDAVHSVKSSDGFYSEGTALPCFACHNPHGSARNNKLNLSDTLGQFLDPTASDAQERQFCFTCHTSDGYGWNSIVGTYTPVAASEGITLKSVVGLDRLAPDNVLTLESKISDHGYVGTSACSDCHDSSHNPKVSLTDEVTSCVDCHTELGGMDASSIEASATYHHVLGTIDGSFVGASLFLGEPDPDSSTGTMYCVTCHTNHIKNSDTVGTLRVSVTSTEGTTSEFGTSEASPGLCISCHDTILARDNPAQLLSTEPTVAAIGYSAYASSGHSYSVAYRGGAMSASCVKCHNSAAADSVPTNLIFFGLHTSSNSSLIARLGANESDPKALCFQCHAQIGEVASPIGKTSADSDWYLAVAMASNITTYLSSENTTVGTIPHDSEMVFTDVGAVGSGHYTAVCSSCHDTHAENSISAKLAGTDWPLTKRSLPTQSVIPASVVDGDGNRPIFLSDVPEGTAPTWITCFAGGCHDPDDMSGIAHSTAPHSSNPVACVDCHVPHMHGADSLTKLDLGAHQVMTWYDPLFDTANQTVADLYAVATSPDVLVKESCTTNQANCHKQNP